jgi:hypothetical protein
VQISAASYSHSFTVKFPGFAGNETLTDFPVLVRLPSAFDYAGCQANGADLRFADENGELLASEVDTWNTEGESLVWVKIPTLKSGTAITAYYGSSSPDAVDPHDVWDSNYVSVWHLGGTGLPLAESTGGGKAFTEDTGTVGYNVSGAVGGAVDFIGSDSTFNSLKCDDDDNLDGLNDFTIEIWTKQSFLDTSYNRFLLTKREAYNKDISFSVFCGGSSKGAMVITYTLDGTTTVWANQNNVPAKPDVWTHTAIVRSVQNTHLFTYLNGSVALDRTNATYGETLWNSATGVRLGGDTGNVNQMFNGQVDEVRISKTARSALWVKTTHATVSDPHFSECSFDNDWTKYSNKLYVKFSGYAGSTTLTDFPCLVRLSAARNAFDYGACKLPDGGDLRFADAEGNLLASEVDTWNPNGESLVWVKVPSLNATTQIIAYYGCATPGAANPRDVWSNGYEGVWHLGEDGLIQRDSTTNGLDFVASVDHDSRITRGVDGGIVGKTVKFFAAEDTSDKKGCLVASDPGGRLAGPPAKTIEFWSRQDYHDTSPIGWDGVMINYLNNSASLNAYRFYEVSGKNGKTGSYAYRITNETMRVQNWFSVNDKYYPNRGEWTHQALRYDTVGGKLPWAVFLRGEKIQYSSGPDEENGWEPMSGMLCLGNSATGSANVFPGNMDEVRISSVSRSDDWIVATRDSVENEGFAAYEQDADETEDWTKYIRRFPVTFPSYAGSDPLTNFPVLVRISELTVTNIYSDSKVAGGGDLRFSDAEGNLLASEVETWNENGVSLVWVKVPSLSASTVIYGYYGCDAPAKVSAKDVWSNGYIGVWHLDETGLVMKDSSWKSADLTCTSGNASKVGRGVAGLVGGAALFDVAEDKYGALSAPHTAVFENLGAITLEMWINLTKQDTTNNRYLLTKWINYNSDCSFCIYDSCMSTPPNNTAAAIFREGQPGVNADKKVSMSISPVEPGSWHHQAFVYEKTNESLANWATYADRTASSGTTEYNEGVRTGYGPLTLGNSTYASAGAFPGMVDELRISNVARSQDWMQTTYDSIHVEDFAKCGAVRDLTIHGLKILVR